MMDEERRADTIVARYENIYRGPGRISIQIPPLLAAPVIGRPYVPGASPILGERSEEDGWVYDSNGVRIRKWFKKYSSSWAHRKFHYWLPRLKDIALAESRRWRAYLEIKKHEIIFDKICELVVPKCPFVTYSIENCDDWLMLEKYYIRHDVFPGRPHVSRSTPWTDRDPPVNQYLGELFLSASERVDQVKRRFYTFDQMFQLCLDKKYANTLEDHAVVQLKINGRNYHIRRVRGSYSDHRVDITTHEKIIEETI